MYCAKKLIVVFRKNNSEKKFHAARLMVGRYLDCVYLQTFSQWVYSRIRMVAWGPAVLACVYRSTDLCPEVPPHGTQSVVCAKNTSGSRTNGFPFIYFGYAAVYIFTSASRSFFSSNKEQWNNPELNSTSLLFTDFSVWSHQQTTRHVFFSP